MTEIHRFTDPDHAALTLAMRDRENPGEVSDQFAAMNLITLHADDDEAITVATKDEATALNERILAKRGKMDDTGGDGLSIGAGDPQPNPQERQCPGCSEPAAMDRPARRGRESRLRRDSAASTPRTRTATQRAERTRCTPPRATTRRVSTRPMNIGSTSCRRDVHSSPADRDTDIQGDCRPFDVHLMIMTSDTATLIRDCLALDADQRAVVANALLESLHDAGDTGEVDATWRAEATRRLAEVREGAVELVDAGEHYARLRASLTA